MSVNQQHLRNLPSVHQLTEDPTLQLAVERFGRDAVVRAARGVVDSTRARLLSGQHPVSNENLLAEITQKLEMRLMPYNRVLNATGVLLHTNLGRAPLPTAAWEAMAAARDYCDLEMDLSEGKRASRLRGIEGPLSQLAGSESGTMVNNCAAAVMLTIAALAGDRPTAVSRGHLVEIGGGFRLPDIMTASGSPLMEVGTTNRTHLADYAEAIDRGAALILLVHRSNFIMSGYVTEPPLADVVALARKREVPVVLDLGSGCLFDLSNYGLSKELTVPEATSVGLDAVVFSGDKLLGGPQGGYIVGLAPVISRIRKHPLARAVRCDKMQLAGAMATLDLYLRGEAEREIPIWRRLSAPMDTLEKRANTWRAATGRGEVIEAAEALGGGTLPESDLKGYALALNLTNPDDFLTTLREQEPAVVGHIDQDRVLLHPRTVDPNDDGRLIEATEKALVTYGREHD